jgi:hypothetical protein
MGCSVPPWELATRPEIWGAWAIAYRTAKHNAAVMRAQIQAAREQGQA